MADPIIPALVRATLLVGLSSLSLASAVDAASPSNGKSKPVEAMTCRDFVQLRDSFKPQVVSYALGYTHAKRPELDAIDVSGVDRLVPVLVRSCRERPTETLVQRIKAFFHRL